MDETLHILSTTGLAYFEEVLGEHQAWAHRCHEISVALVHSRELTRLTGRPARVARGFTPGVLSQHSWVVLSENCYDPEAVIIDLTLWSYVPGEQVVHVGLAGTRPHRPHGSGTIFASGMPHHHGGDTIVLDQDRLSPQARSFLELLGPLDARGWMQLANSPVEGWPAAQIVSAMYEEERLRALIPIDTVGMLTDHNPGGLYL